MTSGYHCHRCGNERFGVPSLEMTVTTGPRDATYPTDLSLCQDCTASFDEWFTAGQPAGTDTETTATEHHPD